MVASLDRVRVTWEGTGTSSPITLGSAISAKFFAPTAALDGIEVSYLIEHQGEGINEVELGRGIYTHSGTILARTDIIASTNGGIGGSAVNFSAGVKHVSLTILASDLAGRFISALPEITAVDGAADFLAVWDATDQALKKAKPNSLPGVSLPTEVDADDGSSPFSGTYSLSTAVRSAPENVTLVTIAEDTDIEAPEDFVPSGEIYSFDVLVEHSGCTASIANDPDGRTIQGVNNGGPVPLGEPGSLVKIICRNGNVLQVEGETGEESTALAAVDMDGNALKNTFVESEAEQTVASSSGTLAVDYSLGNNIFVDLTENITTHTLSNVPASGRRASLFYEILQDTVADRTMVWPSGFNWGDQSAPTLPSSQAESPPSLERIKVIAETRDGGTTWAAAVWWRSV